MSSRRWHQRLLRLVLCLALGAATTVGVAWWCASRPGVGAGFWPFDLGGWRRKAAAVWQPWPSAVPAKWVERAPMTEVRTRRSPGVTVQFAEETVLDPWAPRYMQLSVDAGWPRPALHLHRSDECIFNTAGVWSPTTEWRGLRGGVLMPGQDAPGTRGFQGYVFLPVQPVWPGFAVNTLLYAAAWWPVLIVLAPPLRWCLRLLLWRAGRCDRCRYDLRGLPVGSNERVVCPECGAACRHGPVSDGRRRLARRRLRRGVLCVVLGAATTVAVAWTCTLSWSLKTRRPDAGASERDWPAAAPPFGDLERVRFYRSFGAREVSGWDTFAQQERWAMRAGWPLRCLHMRCIAPIGYRWNVWDDPQAYWNGAVRLPGWMKEQRADGQVNLLPIRPVIVGFVGNTVLYAGVWWGMVVGVRETRRFRCRLQQASEP